LFHKWRLPKSTFSSFIGLGAGILYGIIARLTFGNSSDKALLFIIMSLGFIFLVPLGLGAVTVYFRNQDDKPISILYALLMPWLPCLIFLLATMALKLEGIICIVMALPIFLGMASLGGFLAKYLFRKSKDTKQNVILLGFILLLPYGTSAIESRFPLPQTFRKVDTQIQINADSKTVWNNIKKVSEIQNHEQGFSFFHLIGFPNPIEATLSNEGIGGIRKASFEGGIIFTETITHWQPEKYLRFTIQANPEDIALTTLDEHVTVGGPYFDTLEGSYRMENLGNNQILLHLSSRHRLSTRFNFYSHFWTDWIMRDIQNYILRIIKRRCENRGAL